MRHRARNGARTRRRWSDVVRLVLRERSQSLEFCNRAIWELGRKLLKPELDIAHMAEPTRGGDHSYTDDELRFLAGLRKTQGRTCRKCRWLSMRGQQRGCFPEGKYRKFLSSNEYESGCDMFEPRD